MLFLDQRQIPRSKDKLTVMAALINSQALEELKGLYSGEDRQYHGLGHISALLALLQQHKALFADPDAVEAAIWFHDAIYDSKASDNEVKSAELASARLADSTPRLAEDRIRRIAVMIEATAAHKVPHFDQPAFVSDAEMFLDMDLSILGAEEDAFEQYEAAVRQEYGWVSDEGWRTGRLAVLKSFADRPAIFYSQVFRDLYEQRARRNIARSIERLSVGEVTPSTDTIS